MADQVSETCSVDLINHLIDHANHLQPRLMRRNPGDYYGRSGCCEIAWRAKRADLGRNRRKTLTITFIDLELPGGTLLFGW